ncbi:MAG: family 78 glycoside hydrolase catalytic domain, partial [Candidatus Ornithomonoglobus sp.]
MKNVIKYTSITELKTNDLVNPEAVHNHRPVFGWKMNSNIVGQKQLAYRVIAAADEAMTDIVWDSGKREKDTSSGIQYKGPKLKDRKTYFWSVQVWDKDNKVISSETAHFTASLLSADAWNNSSFICPAEEAQEDRNGSPIFRREFSIDKEIVSTKLYTTALGCYDVFINGKRVGELQPDGTTEYDELKPGFTDMSKRVLFYGYDITHMLAGGTNTISAIVTNGWWNNCVNNKIGGDTKLAFRAQLYLDYADGTSEVIGTDTSWKASRGGPVLYGEIFNGEYYDANADTSWMKSGYDDSGWAAAVTRSCGVRLVPHEGQKTRIRKELERTAVSVTVYEGAVGAGSDRYGVINKKAVYGGDEVFRLKKGRTAVIDFGQNFAGWPEISAEGAQGTEITIQCAEMLNDCKGLMSRQNDGPEGSVYRKNLRGAEATLKYTMNGNG